MSEPVLRSFQIDEEEPGVWSFTTNDHGCHVGYPDALQATAAAMRAFDPNIPRTDVPVYEILQQLTIEKRQKFYVIAGDEALEIGNDDKTD